MERRSPVRSWTRAAPLDRVMLTNVRRWHFRTSLAARCDFLAIGAVCVAGRQFDCVWGACHWIGGQCVAPLFGWQKYRADLHTRRIEVFGLNGFVIGPVIAAMFTVTWEIFSGSRQTSPNNGCH